MSHHVPQLTPARCTRKLAVKEVLAGRFPAGYVAECKEDDLRYLLHINPFGDGKNVLTSRRISKQTGKFVEKQDWCPFIRDYKFPKILKGTILDGGIYKKGLVSTDVVRAMKQGDGVSYICWDILRSPYSKDLSALTQTERWEVLDSIQAHFPEWLHRSVRIPSKLIVKNLAAILQAGGEGVVLKDPAALYGDGWVKVKTNDTYDCIIVGYEPPKSQIYAAKGWIGTVVCAQVLDNATIRQLPFFEQARYHQMRKRGELPLKIVAHPKNMTDELRDDLSRNKDKYLGHVIELTAQQRLKTGLLRSPSVKGLRYDKPASECILL